MAKFFKRNLIKEVLEFKVVFKMNLNYPHYNKLIIKARSKLIKFELVANYFNIRPMILISVGLFK